MGQPTPTQNDSQPIFERIIAEVRARAQAGNVKYGTYLQPHNGRNAMQDFKEELLDAVHYAEQHITEVSDLTAERDQLRAELAAAKEQLEFDRTTCADFVTALDKALDSRFWLTEGRGSYQWDDDRYREEFRDAAVALKAVINPMRKMACNLSSGLQTTAQVVKARVDLRAEVERLRGEVQEAKNSSASLREKVDEHRDCMYRFRGQLEQATARAEAAERERDEARALLRELAHTLNPHEGYDATKLAGWARETVERALEADQAEAQAEQLRRAMQEYFDDYMQDEAESEENCIEPEQHQKAVAVKAALSTTPAQALATVRAAALRDLMQEIESRRPRLVETFGEMNIGDVFAAVADMIDRIESEGV